MIYLIAVVDVVGAGMGTGIMGMDKGAGLGSGWKSTKTKELLTTHYLYLYIIRDQDLRMAVSK